LWLGGVRPLLMASFLLNYWISGAEPFSYHLVNIALHALCCGLVYSCTRRICALAGIAESKQPLIGLFTAGLFLLHPLQTESVDYITSRSEILTACFMLAALLLFLRNFDRAISVFALF